ncbi:MAG: type II toxin-antitoxin system mRNA interferase toxin, RelE/StbE family [Candidatus Woesearchaeota archaeon]
MKKKCKNNPLLENILTNKIEKILENPEQFKPLRNQLSGMRRTHISKSFVLIYTINNKERKVTLLIFEHHDNAYQF